MKRIVVLNPKGGSGKSTIATNLASHFASQGKQTCLLDCDPQGSSNFWLRRRPAELPAIESLAEAPGYGRSTRTWMMTPRRGTEVQVIDTPARPDLLAMGDLLRTVDHILIPVLPCEFDMDVASQFIQDLMRAVRFANPGDRIGTCANRTHADCPTSARLVEFLASLPVPHIATFRDSPNYLKATARGMGLFEMDDTADDLCHWQPLLDRVHPTRTPTVVVKSGPAQESAPRPVPADAPRRPSSRPGNRSRIRQAV